jgi:2-keto-4-pentenoate hydratase/2-oxohepta-3-ene-1,7-dioic acid hydratase in catechol pathway
MTEPVRVARFLGQDGEIIEGVVTGDEIEEVSGLDSMLRGGRRLGNKRKISEVQLLPFGSSRKVVGIGRNYAGHVKELKNELPKEPILLCKVSSSLIGQEGLSVVLRKPRISRSWRWSSASASGARASRSAPRRSPESLA